MSLNVSLLEIAKKKAMEDRGRAWSDAVTEMLTATRIWKMRGRSLP